MAQNLDTLGQILFSVFQRDTQYIVDASEGDLLDNRPPFGAASQKVIHIRLLCHGEKSSQYEAHTLGYGRAYSHG